MAKTRFTFLDRAFQKTVEWVRDVARETGTADLDRAWTGFRAVLHALRDRLIPDEARELGTQLPVVIRGAYFEGWAPRSTPTPERTKEEFLARVAESVINMEGVDPEALTRAVFRVLTRRITTGEIRDVRSVLPKPVQELWPDDAAEEILREREEAGLFESGIRRVSPPPATGRSKIRRARRMIRRAVAQARAAGLPERDLPILTPRGRVRQVARRRRARRGETSGS